MNKKITVGTALIAALLAALLTFQLTYSFVGKEYQAKVDTLTKTQSDFSLLAEADLLIRENYLGGMDDQLVEDGLIKGYVSALGDKYSAYLSAEEYSRYQKESAPSGNGIGVRLTYDAKNKNIVVYNVFQSSPAEEAGVSNGDILIKVNDTPVEELGFYDTLAALSAEEGKRISLTVKRTLAAQSLEMSFDLTTGKVTPNSLSYELLEGDIGYVQIFSFDEGFKEEFEVAISSLSSVGVVGIIFDVRNTAGGNADAALFALDRLLPKGNLVHTVDHKGKKETVKSDENCIDLPFAVLINGNTSFSAEIFASVLKDYGNTTLVGEKTYGKSIDQKVIPLSGGSALLLSHKSYTPPKSPSFESVGVEPDVVCKLGTENLYLVDHDADAQFREAYHLIRNY